MAQNMIVVTIPYQVYINVNWLRIGIQNGLY
jgi:hypothetical protein